MTTLPDPEKNNLEYGYVQLTDSAPLLIADALGYFSDVDLNVTLSREVSWANVRDKLASGHLDGAQMLSPLPLMTTLGASGMRVPLLTGLVMSANGNAVTLSYDAYNDLENPAQELTIAVVHGFSTHHLLLQEWLRQYKRKAKTVIVPPSQMVDSLKQGIIDGFCVGEPWNTLAVQSGVGIIHRTGRQLWPELPEKVFCVSQRWHDLYPATHLRSRVALIRAGAWLADPENLDQAVGILSQKLNLSTTIIRPSLSGYFDTGLDILHEPYFHRFCPIEIGRPDPNKMAGVLDACMDLMGSAIEADASRSLLTKCFRGELFDQAIAHTSLAGQMPAH